MRIVVVVMVMVVVAVEGGRLVVGLMGLMGW